MNEDMNSDCTSQATRREGKRAALALYGAARQGMAPWSRVRIAELSPSGFRLTGITSADPSQPLRIRIPGLQVLTGRVCWHKGKVVGCEFATPLHEAVFTHICTAAGA